MADSRAQQILKTISTFDIENDFQDQKAKEKLSDLFREFIMSDEDVVIEVMPQLIQSMSTLLVDLGITEPEPEVEPVETPTEDKPEEDTEPEDKALESVQMTKSERIVESANNFIY